MTIQSHITIADTHLQASGHRYIKHVFTDHTGKVYEMPLRKVPGAWTETEYAAQRVTLAAELEDHLAAAELEALLNA